MYINNKIKFIDNTTENDEFYCNICNFPFLSLSDFEKKKDYGCCFECYLQFVEARREEWSKGWRPNKNVIKEYVNLRKQ